MPILEQTLAAIKHYCAYQERCHWEVRNKLIQLECYGEDLEEAIGVLIQENYLNEERYAHAFAGGKFRMQAWGKVKIRQQLKAKKVSDYCIKKGMQAINEAEYEQKLLALLERKKESLKSERSPWKKKQKVFQYLLQKGYELDLMQSAWESGESV